MKWVGPLYDEDYPKGYYYLWVGDDLFIWGDVVAVFRKKL